MDLDAGYDIDYVNDMWNCILARLHTPPLDDSIGSSLSDINISSESSQNSTQFNIEIDYENVDAAADSAENGNNDDAENIEISNTKEENEVSGEEIYGDQQIPESYHEVS